MSELSQQEILRYSRHLTLPEVGLEGQRRLKAASVLMVGAGGLGSPLALYLAAAGIGRLGIVEFDAVDASNLQRQVLYESGDVGRPKLEVAAGRLRALNPHVSVEPHDVRLAADNALQLVEAYDLVVDGSDNFPTRYLVNDACVLAGRPNVYGSIFRFEGQASLFDATRGPCYRCLFPEPPAPGSVPSCAEGGVLGILPGIIGAIQATEAIKWFLGRGDSLVGRLLLFDALAMRFRELKLRKDPDCPLCGPQATIRELRETASVCETAVPETAEEIGATELRAALAGDGAPLLLDVRSENEWRIARIDGALLIPMSELEARLGELDPAREIVTVCKVGKRSAQAAALLRDRGFGRVRNLRGGLMAWAAEVDPGLARY